MPFVVKILKEDLECWEPTRNSMPSDKFHYYYKPDHKLLKLSAPERLENLVGEQMFCWIQIEKGNFGSCVRLLLKEWKRHPKDTGTVRLLRIRPGIVIAGGSPLPKIFLKELTPTKKNSSERSEQRAQKVLKSFSPRR